MEYKSNINISSNIYICNPKDPVQDIKFVKNCRGFTALEKLNKRIHSLGTMTSIQLSEVQREELRKGRPCGSEANRFWEKTHGIVKHNNILVHVCRCENEKCIKFSECMNDEPIIREQDEPQNIDSQTYSEVHYEWLGVNITDDIFTEPEIETEEEPIPEAVLKAPIIISDEYIKLTDSLEIIKADISSHILVNAGPGTGKTHTIVERLEYIIRSGEIEELGQIWVLCYTNATRDVILQRLTDKGLGDKARQLVICTLDSLVWQYLTSKLDEDDNFDALFSLGYTVCIQEFNSSFDPEEFEDVKYIIIDELQDIVNERAKMVLKILNAVNCGYLLLGDNCQAIYDYDCNDINSIDSVQFYKDLNTLLLSRNALRYELLGNHRQSIELTNQSDKLRKALLELGTNEANTFFSNHINSIAKVQFSPENIRGVLQGTIAILTRTNGEAEWVSALLHKQGIAHNLLRAATPHISLHRWIADVFWDYREPIITKSDFIQRYMIRVENSEESAKNAFFAIIESLESNEPTDYIELKELSNSLKRGKHVHTILTNKPYEWLTVSTIHKAKGREFDHVYLLSNGFKPNSNSTIETRTWYVGMTRPKSTFSCLTKTRWNIYKSKTPTGRCIKAGFSRNCNYGEKARRIYCDSIVIGLPNDIKQSGFVEGDLEKAAKRQEYIANNVNIDDMVAIHLEDGIYQIYHKGMCIGSLASNMVDELCASIQSLGWSKKPPPQLLGIYVKNIVTIMPHSFPNSVATLFKGALFWLGVELTGVAKINWRAGN